MTSEEGAAVAVGVDLRVFGQIRNTRYEIRPARPRHSSFVARHSSFIIRPPLRRTQQRTNGRGLATGRDVTGKQTTLVPGCLTPSDARHPRGPGRPPEGKHAGLPLPTVARGRVVGVDTRVDPLHSSFVARHSSFPPRYCCITTIVSRETLCQVTTAAPLHPCPLSPFRLLHIFIPIMGANNFLIGSLSPFLPRSLSPPAATATPGRNASSARGRGGPARPIWPSRRSGAGT